MFLMNNVPTPRGVSMVKEMTTDLKALGMEFPVVVKLAVAVPGKVYCE